MTLDEFIISNDFKDALLTKVIEDSSKNQALFYFICRTCGYENAKIIDIVNFPEISCYNCKNSNIMPIKFAKYYN